jgi:hypothetical protein
MNTRHILLPAIAALALFAANPASALTPAWRAGVEESTSNLVPVAKYGHWYYQCNKYFGHHDLQRCYQMHGLNSQGQRVKGGM